MTDLEELEEKIKTLAKDLDVLREEFESTARAKAEQQGYVLEQKGKDTYCLRKPKSKGGKGGSIIGPLEIVTRFIRDEPREKVVIKEGSHQ